MRLWHLSPSVNSIFKHACAAIHWGYTSDFLSDPSSTSILYVCEQRRLWWLRGCAISPEPSLFAYTIISWAGSVLRLIVGNYVTWNEIWWRIGPALKSQVACIYSLALLCVSSKRSPIRFHLFLSSPALDECTKPINLSISCPSLLLDPFKLCCK